MYMRKSLFMDSRFQGIVLAGGKSSRFGEDKALALLDGVTFLETAVRRLQEIGLRVTVITNRTRDYSGLHLGCDIQTDIIEEKGPLGGRSEEPRVGEEGRSRWAP